MVYLLEKQISNGNRNFYSSLLLVSSEGMAMNSNDVAAIAGIDPLLVDSALKGCLCDPESLSFRFDPR
jgi:hypothetical protein